MIKIVGVILTLVALILATVIGYNLVSTVIPQYLSMWVISTTFTWVGVILTHIPD